MGVKKVYNAQDCVGNLSHVHMGEGGGGSGGSWPPTVQLCCSATATVYELCVSELLHPPPHISVLGSHSVSVSPLAA